jgi:hypothetical protein
VAEEHRFFRAFTTFFDASKTHSTRRAASVGPGVAPRDHDPEEQRHSPVPLLSNHSYDEGGSRLVSGEDFSLSGLRLVRNASVDASHYHPHHIAYREEQLTHAPPYSPSLSLAPSSSNTPSAISSLQSLSPAHSLEEFRAALNWEHNTLSEHTDIFSLNTDPSVFSFTLPHSLS